MAKTDKAKNDRGAPDQAAKTAAPERVAAFRAGLSAESRAAALLMARYRKPATTGLIDSGKEIQP